MTTTASTLSVITDGNTFSVVVRGVALFTDAGLTVPVVFPQSVSADVTWYAAALTRPGVRQIEVLVTASDGTSVPVPTVQGLPATVDCAEGVVDYSGPASSGGSSAVVATYDFDFTQAVALAAGVDTGIAIPANSLILSAAVRVGTAFDTSIAAVGLAEDQAGAVAAAASGFDGLITGGITVADTALNDCPHTLVANSAYNQTAGMTYTDALTEWWLALNMNAETPAAGAATVTIVYLPI